MMTELHTHKRRRSFLTLVRKNRNPSELSLLQLNQCDIELPEAGSKSCMFKDGSPLEHETRGSELRQRQLSFGGCSNKENVPSNRGMRGIIKIKPRKYVNSCHFLWCREG